MSAVASWAAAGIEPERVVAELRRRFPRVSAWRGESTGSWWAYTLDHAGRPHLLEADDPVQLGRLLADVRQAPQPEWVVSARNTDVARRAPTAPVPRLAAHTASRPRSMSGAPHYPRRPAPSRPVRPSWWRRALGALVVLE
ncbi:hypothetical protein GCM10023085_72790 [Actinomadura viridis]|uniref:Uncharacterized protein n=1 Tax=Actinomadura viridis TaxID=58110 RepID=A0A931DNP6_9ACTN|nr:hypothetical protein [Actinomadura viridis]MBG6092962.1 hypothetical protein [Actinomadura viridis]